MRRIMTAAALTATALLVTGCQQEPPPVSAQVQEYYDTHVAPQSLGSTPEPTATSSAPEPEVVTRDAGEPLRVLFAGDSLTGGLSATVQTEGFKWLMLNKLEGFGPVEEFNSALSGGTTLEVSEKYEVPSGLDLAVVELGTNDLGALTPLPQFEEAYVSLIDRIVEGSPDAGLVCAGVWEANGGGPEAASYDQIIEDTCTENGGRFVPLKPIYVDHETVIGPVGAPAFGGVADNFHPNSAGHEAIAAALLDVIVVK